MPKLIKNHIAIDDDWLVVRIAEGETIADVALPHRKLIVPFPVWQARRQELASRPTLGVWLSDTEGPELIAEDLPLFQVVAIDFPKFFNGRGYSSAALLRTRYGYRGELRAIGDVLRDQMFYLARVGFDAFALRDDQTLESALKALDDFSVTYQGATDKPEPLFRRLSRGRMEKQA
jgi:hypothetical protein